MPSFRTAPVSPILGTEILDVDLREPYELGFEDAMRAEIDRSHLLLVRGQQLSREDQLRFVTIFGEVSRKGAAERAGHGDVSYISNRHPEGRGGDGEMMFHSDQAALPDPAGYLSLYGQQVPSSGGETMYSSMVRAYDVLPQSLKDRLAGLHIEHSYDYGPYLERSVVKSSVASIPHVVKAVHPAVRLLPRTGTPAVYINEVHAKRFVELSDAESTALFKDLLDIIRGRDNVYTHRWRVGDLIVWSNLGLLHARTPWNLSEPRTLQRVQVA